MPRTTCCILLALPILTLGLPTTTIAGAQSRAPTAPVATREQTADQQVVHVLNRLAFGPRPGDTERVRAMGIDRWIAQQLEPAQLSDPVADAFVQQFVALSAPIETLFTRYPPPQLTAARQRLRRGATLTSADSARLQRELLDARRATVQMFGEFQAAYVGRAISSERQLELVLTDFWLNHFSVYAAKGPYGRHYAMAYERDAVRPHVLGRFRDLLGTVAQSPAMLAYLDNALSRADSGQPTLVGTRQGRRPVPRAPRGLNENFARELLELHTLGVDGGYSQQDVIEVARAFTGWTLRPPQAGGGFIFRPELHDAGEKVVLGVRIPAGRGIEDGELVLDILARHPATARFVARKLAIRFVSDAPPDDLVDRAASAYLTTDGDLRAVVRTIVTSPEFFSAEAWRAKVKSPFEVVVSAARALGAHPDPTPRTAALVAALGQPLFGHQAPNGWPELADAWINTGSILGRINFGLAVAGGALPGLSTRGWPGMDSLAGASRDMQVDALVRSLLGGDVSPDTRAVLLSGHNPLLGAAEPDVAAPQPDDMADRPGMRRTNRQMRPARGAFGRIPVLEGFPQMIGLALGSPEFQRR